MYLLLCRPSVCENAGHHQPGQLRCGNCPAWHYAFGQQYPDPGPSCSQASIPLTCCYESMPLSELMTHSIVTLWQIGDRKSCCATPKGEMRHLHFNRPKHTDVLLVSPVDCVPLRLLHRLGPECAACCKHRLRLVFCTLQDGMLHMSAIGHRCSR